MRRLSVAALCALICLQAAPALPDDGRAALQRIYGPAERLRSLKTLIIESEITAFGLKGVSVAYFAAPDKFTATFTFPQFSMTQVYNAGAGWLVDQNRSVTPLSGTDLQALVTQIYFNGYAFLSEDDSAEFKLSGSSIHNGRGCYDFHVTPTGGLPVNVSIDSVTGDILFTRVYKDDLTLESSYSDFRDVDGYQIPFSARTVASTPLLNIAEVVTAVRINQPLDDSLFAQPRAAAGPAVNGGPNFIFPADNNSITLPLEYIDGHVFVRVRVNGSRPLRMLLDSGAGTSALARRTVEALGLSATGELPGKGVSGYAAIGVVQVDELSVGELKLLDRTIGAFELPAEMQAALGGIDGIIGFELLHTFAVQLDFQRQTMTVFHPLSSPSAFPGLELPFTYITKIPAVVAAVGSDSGNFIVDIGNRAGVVIHKAFAADAGLDSLPTGTITGQRAIGGIGGSTAVREVYLPSLRLDTAVFHNIPALLLESGAGIAASTEVAGNLGTPFLDDFLLTFDYPRQRIWLARLD